jgi:hypothetical protein
MIAHAKAQRRKLKKTKTLKYNILWFGGLEAAQDVVFLALNLFASLRLCVRH